MNYSNQENIVLGLSEKKDGPMKFSLENRDSYLSVKNLRGRIVVSAGLVHGNNVVVIDNDMKSGQVPNCDALITNDPRYLLTLTVADCLPIYFYDKRNKVIALAHAGWRGVAANLASEVVKVFKNNYHSEPENILVFIGPHIKDCHFEVKSDVASQFNVSDIIIRDGKTYLNLSSIVLNQLLTAGIPNANISVSEECTACVTDKYYSYRRDNPKELETMLAYIGL